MVDTNYVYVYLRNDLPRGVNELVSPGIDGYTVLISDRLDREQQLKAYEHALKHIEDGDFDIDSIKSVQEIESRAHESATFETLISTDWIAEEIARLKREQKKLKAQMRRKQAQINQMVADGYDFFAAAEARWLDPEAY